MSPGWASAKKGKFGSCGSYCSWPSHGRSTGHTACGSLGEIVGRKTALPVTEVTTVPAITPDHIYVIAPGRTMTVRDGALRRSEEHTSELQSLMRISYAVFCLKKKRIVTSKK